MARRIGSDGKRFRIGDHMNRFVSSNLLALMVVLCAFGAGCGKKSAAGGAATESAAPDQPAAGAPAAASTAKLTGGNDVLAAVDRKDYDGAIAAWIRVGQSVTTREQQVQYTTLSDELRIKLLEAGPSDPKVAEALTTFRRITGGR
jgi:hypothetical protein